MTSPKLDTLKEPAKKCQKKAPNPRCGIFGYNQAAQDQGFHELPKRPGEGGVFKAKTRWKLEKNQQESSKRYPSKTGTTKVVKMSENMWENHQNKT